MGRIVQSSSYLQRPESNVALERTPRVAHAAAPHLSACMTGSKQFFTSLSDSPLACHKRKLTAGVTLNSIRWAYQMRATLFIIFSLFAVTACDAAPQYKNAAEFEAVVKSWKLDGKSESEAISILTNNKFSCKERACYLELKGFPCNQKLRVLLDVNGKGDVVNAAIWKLQDGQLPTVCL